MQRIVHKVVLPLVILGCVPLLAAAPAPAPAPAVTVAEKSAKSFCSGTATATAGMDWQYAKGSTSIAGHPGYMQGYDLTLDGNTIMLAEVKGFNEQGQAVWAPVFAMEPRDPHRQINVTWGNSLATPEIRIKPALGQMLGGAVKFLC